MSGTRFEGLLYRALNPIHAKTPMSGAGAAHYGGRFNRIGRKALYTALHPDTAIREANQVGTLQPTTLVALRADVGPVFDTRKTEALSPYGMTAGNLTDADWRYRMIRKQSVPTQNFAETLIAEGYAGSIVRSFAAGAPETAVNMVLWQWTPPAKASLEIVDDDDRLELRK